MIAKINKYFLGEERELLLKLVQLAIEEPTYESEYAHRMEEICHYCGNNLTDGEPHKNDCLHLLAVQHARA